MLARILAISLLCNLLCNFQHATAGEKKTKKKTEDPDRYDRKAEQALQARNASLMKNGGRVSLRFINPEAGKDKRSTGYEIADGSTHTRCVCWKPPYEFTIEFVDTLPITEINLIQSDYQLEEHPKDVEVELSDGTVIKKTLEKRPAQRRKKSPRQTIPVNKNLAWIKVRIMSHYEGGKSGKGKTVTWGGIAEVEAITSADLTKYLIVPDHNPKSPAYVKGGRPRNDYTGLKTVMPTTVPLGTYPGIYMTAEELKAMYAEAKACARAKEMLDKLFTTCDEWCQKTIVLPDPKVPAQMKDRSDKQAKAHDLMAKMSGWLGYAYQLSGDEKYANKAKEILVGYAKLYPNDYKEHKGVHGSDTSKVMAQRLSEAMWLIPLIQSYDLIHDAPCMTDADRDLVEKDLIRCAVVFINRKREAELDIAGIEAKNPEWRTAEPDVERRSVGNWMLFYNAAYIQAGVVLRDQDWIDFGAYNFKRLIKQGIGEDGMWGEGAIGYMLFARMAMMACAEPLARKGIDVYGFAGCRMKNMFDSPLKYAYPDGTSPGINDSGRVSIGGSWTAMAYDMAYLRYKDPNYGSIVNACGRQIFQSPACYFPTRIYKPLPEVPMQGLKSLIYDSLGYAILRGTDGGGQTYLLMDYGPHGGAHGHPDKLNLILYADGDELSGEPVMYRYEDPRHAEWTKTTIGHSTVGVDEHKQMPNTGKLRCFYDAGAVKVMRGESTASYPGVGLDRTVVQMPGYIADIFHVWAAAKHTYDYPLCFRGYLDALAGVDPAALKPMGSPAKRGYKHIAIKAPVAAEANWTGIWTRPASEGDKEAKSLDEKRKHPANEIKVMLVGAPGTMVYPGQDVDLRHRVVVRRQCQTTTFAAIIDPYKATDAVKAVDPLPLEGAVRGYGLKVTRQDGGVDLILVRFDQQPEGKPGAASPFAGGSTDALVSVVRLAADGKVIEMGMLGGTQLKHGDQALALDAPGIQWSGQ